MPDNFKNFLLSPLLLVKLLALFNSTSAVETNSDLDLHKSIGNKSKHSESFKKLFNYDWFEPFLK